MQNVFYVKDYLKDGISDSEAIKLCFADADKCESRTVIFDGKDYHVDESIILASNTHVIIDNCAIMQNDRVFDNIFRGANVEVDPEAPYSYPLNVTEIKNIKIEGRGNARLIGTSVPRVGYHPGKKDYQQMNGDFWGWRTLMIFFSLGEDIEICGVELSKTMCWAITFEWCTRVYVHDIAIYATVKNGDGIDFRSGCHHCKVENISGYTADDTVACTALSTGKRAVYPNAKSVYPIPCAVGFAGDRTNDIHDIEVKGVNTGGLCHGMICLAANGNKVYNIKISDFNEAPEGARTATVSIYTGYGTGYTAGDIHDIYVEGIHATQARYALEVRADVRGIKAKDITNTKNDGLEYVIYPTASRKTGFRLGLSTCGTPVEETDEALFAAYRAANVAEMELSAKRDEAFKYDFAKISSLAYKYGTKLASLHLPFMPFDEIDISKPELADKTVERLSELIRRASREANIKTYVIHPSGEPIEDNERPVRMECAKNSLAKLAAVARECGVVIAVENLPRTCLGKNSAEILELISPDPTLKVCFDTNHLLSESHESFIKATAPYMVTTHISDYDFVDERHVLPGEGMVDWQKLLSDLTESGYAGPWMYEIGLSAETPRIKRERDLSCEDFYRNADELFHGVEPTVIPHEKKF